ncbi:DUF6627 family protein [Marinobacterium jannaschii]|uniref:DUF6627 family protein n=1 Tax=Marinobacterium jannaschii TaxID=64970 RepID=UPI00048495EC|nr:DUF6627 family protein [Marinobacterium jannaschii]
MNIIVRRCFVLILVFSMAFLPLSPAVAALVSTPELVQLQSDEADRSRLIERLQSQALASQLEAYGIDPQLAQDRVRFMTSAEVAMLNQKLDQLPAGQGIGGLIVFLFLVFVITDAIGATDVFTFVRPVR